LVLHSIICAAGFTTLSKVEIEKEKTKQIELQLKIEMIKASVTNTPVIKLEKP